MTFRRPSALAAAFAFAIAFVVVSPAPAEEVKSEKVEKGESAENAKWALLGTRPVTDKVDHDSIEVTAKEGAFTKLQVRVVGHAVQFRSMKIHFGNGDNLEVKLEQLLRPGHATKPIDVPGAERIVKSVEFVYDAPSVGAKGATIRLFGKH